MCCEYVGLELEILGSISRSLTYEAWGGGGRIRVERKGVIVMNKIHIFDGSYPVPVTLACHTGHIWSHLCLYTHDVIGKSRPVDAFPALAP